MYTKLPSNTTFKHLLQVAYHAPDVLYHYHFIHKQNVMKSAETRLYDLFLSRIQQSYKKIEELEGKVQSELKTYSPTTQCLISQKNKCTSKQIGQYQYSICIAGEAKQDNTRLGEWKLDLNSDYYKNATVEYSGGVRCWNGIERKLIVKYECGKKEEIISISEPSTCLYEAVMKSPCFCSEELVSSLREKLVFDVCSKVTFRK